MLARFSNSNPKFLSGWRPCETLPRPARFVSATTAIIILGQVLYTGNDFMIVDFEGEPARPLTERRAKALAMRDVAGMLRSFQYAAYAALFGQVPGISPESAESNRVEALVPRFGMPGSAQRFLQTYLDRAASCSFLSPEPAARRLLLDAFLLQKAVYEISYELNNRPDWVRIPLRGILSLVA